MINQLSSSCRKYPKSLNIYFLSLFILLVTGFFLRHVVTRSTSSRDRQNIAISAFKKKYHLYIKQLAIVKSIPIATTWGLENRRAKGDKDSLAAIWHAIILLAKDQHVSYLGGSVAGQTDVASGGETFIHYQLSGSLNDLARFVQSLIHLVTQQRLTRVQFQSLSDEVNKNKDFYRLTVTASISAPSESLDK